MSVLIKGMEMPEKCGKCRFATAFECEVTKNFIITFNVRQIDCPLVPVPPHGRLIDADSLALLVLNWISTQEKAYPHEDSNALAWRLGAKAMGNQIYRDIKAYPTIIEAEEGET